jgi:hypothetical protein
MTVPQQCILSPERARKESALTSCIESGAAESAETKRLIEDAHFWQSVFIMEELVNSTTEFGPNYLKDIRNYRKTIGNDQLQFWTDQQLDGLKGTYALHQFKRNQKQIAEEYELIEFNCPPDQVKHFSLKAYQEAKALSVSRAHPQGLLPGIDIANHYVPNPDAPVGRDHHNHAKYSSRAWPGVSESGSKKGQLQLWAREAFEAGEEVTVSYNMLSNGDCLMRYGFVTPWIHERTCLSTARLLFVAGDLPKSPFDKSRRPMAVATIESHDFVVDSCGGEALKQTMSFARWWLSEVDDDQLMKTCGKFLSPKCDLITHKVELSALELLEKAINNALNGMAGGTLDDEEALVEGGDLKGRAFAVAVVRRDEKYVLQRIMKFITDSKEQLKAEDEAKSTWRSYITHDDL